MINMKFEDRINLEEKFIELCETGQSPRYFSQLVCPELEGYEDIKLATLLLILSPHDTTPNQRDRLHMLLYGNPGTGKTVILRYLHREFDAEYLTHDTTRASLKADARRKDLGSQILHRAHGRIICFDEFSLMKDREELRDAMEDGFYKVAKAGKEQVFPAEIRVVAATNDIKLSEAMVDRFDFCYRFDDPTPDFSVRVAKRLTRIYAGLLPAQTDELKEFVEWIEEFEPSFPHDLLTSYDAVWESYFSMKGIGWNGRRIASVLRIAKAYAKLNRRDVLPEDLVTAISIKDPDLTSIELKRLKRLAERL